MLAAAGIAISSFPVTAAYRPPDMEKKIFAADDIQLDKFSRAGLVGALVSVARDFNKEEDGVEYDTRSYALAIAGRLDKDNSKVQDCLDQLKSNGKTIDEEKAEKKRTSSRLYSGVRALMRKKDNKANMTCAAYCVDIALLFDPDGERKDKFKEMEEELKKGDYKVKWKGLLKSPIHHNANPFGGGEQEFVKVEREMPGGDAKEFARRQSRIIGLSVRRLASGKHAGAASSVIVTALKEDDQDGLLFKFDQKVGTMMAGSLEEVIKFLRVRYGKDKIPNGYKVDIVLGDKHQLVDGPSGGTAFSLVIDSLFSGEEIDPAYACTGTITADGESGIIGGVAGKIRGAINRDCKIVGIPYGNAKGVYDSFLLDGMDSLLKINVFTQRNFDEAHKLSRKDKDADVLAAMDNYKQVAALVKKDGPDILKNQAVKDKLQEVLDKAPNHLCAKVLLDFANGQHVKTLSVRGTLDEIDTELSAFGRGGIGDEGKATAEEGVEHLERIKDMIDSRFKDYHSAALSLCQAIVKGANEGEEKDAYAKRIRNLYSKASSARSKILGDPKIVEEMN
ncbi:hypothetical protein NT6N_22920 [Oceaniferula spumae]|uniref:Lon proteolytic domain-containing protein n=1 Tax=Oceaniferula spumae TaxID=2979115 RepID=A0AAT9FMA4_9BACT